MFNVNLKSDVWFEYVETKANLADAPSRFDFKWLNSMGSTFVEMVVPHARDFLGHFQHWLSLSDGDSLKRKIRSRASSREKRARRL